MLRTFLLILAFGLLGPLVPAPAASSPVQDELTLDDRAKEFKALLKSKEPGGRAIEMIDQFLTLHRENRETLQGIEEQLEFGEGNSRDLKKQAKEIGKDQEKIAATVWLGIQLRDDEIEENRQLWTACAYAWGEMGRYGARYLWKAAFDVKRFSRDYEFQKLCIERLGATHDYDQWERLRDMLDYHNEMVAAAAGTALSEYGEAPGKVRRECTERLVKLLESRHNAATDSSDTTAIRIYNTVRQPWLKALTALTGQSFHDPLDWTRWWNDNKKSKQVWG